MSLPPLSNPKTRVKLLAASYQDAVLGSDDGGRGSKPGSRAQGHNPELWPHGSYRELQHAIDDLRQTLPAWTRCFWRVYVEHGAKLVYSSRGVVQGYRAFTTAKRAPKGSTLVKGERARTLGYITVRDFGTDHLSTVVRADAALARIVKAMGDTIHVPQVVAENAGYSADQARTYERKRRDAA